MVRRIALFICMAASLAAPLAGQGNPAAREAFRAKRLPQQAGFRVFIVPDMEGMGSAVDIHEVIAGNEGEQYRNLSSPDYWDRYRLLLTQEVNATIRGARLAGARSFVVNEGHGGNLFANVLPWDLDTAAILVRGFPKPLVMITGIDSTFGTMMFTGAHANAGSPGVMAHNFAFDSFTVNGRVLNEAGIAAFIGGEMGVPMALAAGDDALTAETREMLGPIETVTVKIVYSRSAAAGLPPAQVHRLLRAGAARAVRRVRSGELKPLALSRPYQVRFCLRRSYDDWVRTTVGRLSGVRADGGPGCFAYTSESAEAVGNLLNEIEWTVLKP